jgi:hypothetical protein
VSGIHDQSDNEEDGYEEDNEDDEDEADMFGYAKSLGVFNS